MGLNSKNEFFMSRDILFNPELTPPLWSISSNSKQKKFLYFKNVLDISRKKVAAAPWLFNFAKEFLKICLKDKTKSHELLSMIGL